MSEVQLQGRELEYKIDGFLARKNEELSMYEISQKKTLQSKSHKIHCT